MVWIDCTTYIQVEALKITDGNEEKTDLKFHLSKKILTYVTFGYTFNGFPL